MRSQEEIKDCARGILLGALLGDSLSKFWPKDMMACIKNGPEALYLENGKLPFTQMSVHITLVLEAAMKAHERMTETNEYVNFATVAQEATSNYDASQFVGMRPFTGWQTQLAQGLVAAPLAMTILHHWCEPDPTRNTNALALNLSGFKKEERLEQAMTKFAASLLLAIMGNCDTPEKIRFEAARLSMAMFNPDVAQMFTQGENPRTSNPIIDGTLIFCQFLEKSNGMTATDLIIRNAARSLLSVHHAVAQVWLGALCGAWAGAASFDASLLQRQPCHPHIKQLLPKI